jgi:hypothetical protein
MSLKVCGKRLRFSPRFNSAAAVRWQADLFPCVNFIGMLSWHCLFPVVKNMSSHGVRCHSHQLKAQFPSQISRFAQNL